MYREEEMKNVAAVTSRSLSVRPYLEQIERICRLHPQAVIVREKDLTEEQYGILAGRVLALCRRYGVDCIYHTYPEAALDAGVQAIHLPLGLLQQYHDSGTLESFTHIGTSVHSLEQARLAIALGATCLTAGHIYPTECKKGAEPRGLSFLQQICRFSSIPVWAIGGIHPGTGQVQEILSAGAAGACIMSGMMQI